MSIISHLDKTTDDWLKEAERCEKIMNNCGPLDPAYRIFKQDRDFYLILAVKRDDHDYIMESID